MSFEEAQEYASNRGIDIPWNDGDIFIDEREITRTVGNVLRWALLRIEFTVSWKTVIQWCQDGGTWDTGVFR